MLRQDSDETFDTSHQGAVDHDRSILLPFHLVRARIAQLEALRQIEVELNGWQISS